MRHYRPDIDGLRAIAVIAVVLFHCNSSWLPGGFIGVDVFFVISGFLITNIILSGLDRNDFSLASFHGSRIRRIFPAYFVVIFFTLLAGVVLLAPDDFRALDKSAFKSILLVPNIHFASKLDYFAPQAEEMPLLHLWSLGVELQFYFVWPFILMLFYKLGFSLKRMMIATGCLVVASVMYAEWLIYSNEASKAYYLFPARAAALLIGCLLAMYERNRMAEQVPFAFGVQILGLALILGSAFFAGELPFPGVNALWPAIGAALLIFSGKQQTVLSKVLTIKPMVYIGLVSYAIYLWHWPLLAYLRYTFGLELGWQELLSAILLTWLLADLSKRFIEEPIQTKKLGFKMSWRRYHAFPGLIILLLIIAPSKLTEGLKDRSPLFADRFSNISEKGACYKNLKGDCRIGLEEGKDLQAVFVGDSHSAHFEPMLADLANASEAFIVSRTTSNCDSINVWTSTDQANKRCQRLAKILKEEKDRYRTLFLAGRWDARLESLGEDELTKTVTTLFSELSERLENIVILSQIPKYQKDIYREVQLSKRFGKEINSSIDMSYKAANDVIKAVSAGFAKVTYIETDHVLCGPEECIFEVDDLPIYKDDDHLNNLGGDFLASRMRDDQLLRSFF